MRICVTSTAGDLDAQIDPIFGKCPHFVIVDPDTMEFDILSNEDISALGGACLQLVQVIIDNSVDLVITGNVGPNAIKTLSSAGIEIVTGASGTVRNSVEMYKSGRFQKTDGTSVSEQGKISGMGPGTGGGRGIAIPPIKDRKGIQIINEQIGILEEELDELQNRLKNYRETKVCDE